MYEKNRLFIIPIIAAVFLFTACSKAITDNGAVNN
jgi:hypothetical protein